MVSFVYEKACFFVRTEPPEHWLPKADSRHAEIFALSPLLSTEGNVKVQRCIISAPRSCEHADFTFLLAFQLGYSTDELDQLYCCVPSSVASTLKELFQLVQEQNMNRISSLKNVHAGRTVSNTFPQSPDCRVEMLPSLSSDSGPYALLRASYDPSNQRTHRIDLNPRMADLLGVPLDIAPSLFATHGLAVPIPAWDCLCAFVDTMLHLSSSSIVRFFRLCCGYRRPCRTALVSGTISKTFNAVGEVLQVPVMPA